MRLIGTLQNENDARRLAGYLKRQGIENNCDVSFDAQSGHMSYQVWVHDEDRMDEAQAAFEKFVESPSNAAFDSPITERLKESEEEPGEEEVVQERRIRTPFTTFIMTLCTVIFFLNFIEEYPMLRGGAGQSGFLITPIQSLLLFDVPPVVEKLEQLIEKHQIPPDQKAENLSPEIKAEIEELDRTPFWRGIYDWFLLKVKGGDTAIAEGPLFEKIRQGEVWRLFSPAVLHRDLLHILFNMIWVWVLSRPIEQRIGAFRLILLSLVAGIGSNVAQYLMSGPFFIGYSGVVVGLAGFTWMRERVAPWEGYPLNRATILFLLLFIGGMFLLQFSSFVLQLFTSISFDPNIANTAHIAGGVIGAALGRLSFFSMRAGR
jgi:GlpG protein